MGKALGGWLILAASAICWSLTAHAAPTQRDAAQLLQAVRLGGQKLTVPRRYLDEGWLAWQERAPQAMPGLDDGSGTLMLTIDAAEAEQLIPGYQAQDGKLRDHLRIRLETLTGEERGRYLDPGKFADIWQATGDYTGRIVEQDAQRGVFRVYRKIEHPYSWEILRVAPGAGPIPSDVTAFWVGRCLKTSSPLSPSASCRSYVVSGNIAVHFNTSELNIHLADAIRARLMQLLAQWQQPANQ